MLEPLLSCAAAYKACYAWIYLFHMPMFAFVSGQLLRLQGGSFKLHPLLLLYLIFQPLYYIFDRAVLKLPLKFSYLTPNWVLWFLLSLMLWNSMALGFRKLKYSMPLALILSILSGYDSSIGYFLSLSRTLVLFPFFYWGYQTESRSIRRLAVEFRFITSLASALSLLLTGLYIGQLDLRQLYNSFSYQALGHSNLQGAALRVSLLLAAFCIILSLLRMIKNHKTFLSIIGERTLAIYLLHGLIIKYLKHIGAYQLLTGVVLLDTMILTIAAAALTYLLSGNVFHLGFKGVLRFLSFKLIRNTAS